MDDLYKSPTIDEMKEMFGDSLHEERIEHRESDVKDFIKLLDKARDATKKHSIPFSESQASNAYTISEPRP